MQATRIIFCLWPGLSRLWWRGDWSGLWSAISFSALLNFALVATYIWPESFGNVLPVLSWLGAAAMWIYGAVRSYRQHPRDVAGGDDALAEGDVDLFVEAQGEYLKGHWFEAESKLTKWLGKRVDVEAILLLATLYRHTRRVKEAQEQLQRLQRLEGGARWPWEIRRELELLKLVAEGDPTGGASGAAAA